MAERRRKRSTNDGGGRGYHRSTMQWVVRLGLAGTAAALGVWSVTFSLAQALAERDPLTAHRLAPYDGRIAGLMAMRELQSGLASSKRTDTVDLATRALRYDPTAVAAASVLGIDAQLAGHLNTARQWFAYGEKLSRRNQSVQLWLIEDSVSRNDIGSALRHYDIALRTHPDLAELLFPVLATASAEPAVRAQLIPKLRQGPRWGQNFINYMSGNTDPVLAAAVFRELGQAGIPVPADAKARVVDSLISRGQAALAWQYYAAGHPTYDRRRLRDARFRAPLDSPSKFDWILTNDGTITTSIEGTGDNTIFSFFLPGGIGGQLLQQYQVLPTGQYRLEGIGAGGARSGRSNPYWIVACLSGRELGRVDMGPSGKTDQRFTLSFSVPQDCPVQTVTLVARPSDAADQVDGEVRYVTLSPGQ